MASGKPFEPSTGVHVKQDGRVFDKSIYMALGVKRQGRKENLGLWAAHSEGAKFWLAVMNELQHRGVKDILIAGKASKKRIG